MKPNITVVGYDPSSVSSSMAIYTSNHTYAAYTTKNASEIVAILNEHSPVFALVESVSRVDKLVKDAGRFCGILDVMRIPYIELTAVGWRNQVGLDIPKKVKGDSYNVRRKIIKTFIHKEARVRFPSVDLSAAGSIDQAEALYMSLVAYNNYIKLLHIGDK